MPKGKSKSARVVPTRASSLAAPKVLSARAALSDVLAPVEYPTASRLSTARSRRGLSRSPSRSPAVSPVVGYRNLNTQDFAALAKSRYGRVPAVHPSVSPVHAAEMAMLATAPGMVHVSSVGARLRPADGKRWALDNRAGAISGRSAPSRPGSLTHTSSVSRSRSKASVEVCTAPPKLPLATIASASPMHAENNASRRSARSAAIYRSAPNVANPLAAPPPRPTTPPVSAQEQRVRDCRGIVMRESGCVKFRRGTSKAFGGWSKPSLVTPSILLGDKHDAANLDKLTRLGVSHVLVLSEHLVPQFPDLLHYYAVNIKDAEESNLVKEFQPCFAFIDQAVDAGTRCLVHCVAGVSRSATIVLAYLMARHGMTLATAMRTVRIARPISMPNEGFRLQLALFELQLRGCSSVAASKERWWNFYAWNSRKAALPPAAIAAPPKRSACCIM